MSTYQIHKITLYITPPKKLSTILLYYCWVYTKDRAIVDVYFPRTVFYHDKPSCHHNTHGQVFFSSEGRLLLLCTFLYFFIYIIFLEKKSGEKSLYLHLFIFLVTICVLLYVMHGYLSSFSRILLLSLLLHSWYIHNISSLFFSFLFRLFTIFLTVTWLDMTVCLFPFFSVCTFSLFHTFVSQLFSLFTNSCHGRVDCMLISLGKKGKRNKEWNRREKIERYYSSCSSVFFATATQISVLQNKKKRTEKV